jgi:hypothetical protein
LLADEGLENLQSDACMCLFFGGNGFSRAVQSGDGHTSITALAIFSTEVLENFLLSAQTVIGLRINRKLHDANGGQSYAVNVTSEIASLSLSVEVVII